MEQNNQQGYTQSQSKFNRDFKVISIEHALSAITVDSQKFIMYVEALETVMWSYLGDEHECDAKCKEKNCYWLKINSYKADFKKKDADWESNMDFQLKMAWVKFKDLYRRWEEDMPVFMTGFIGFNKKIDVGAE